MGNNTVNGRVDNKADMRFHLCFIFFRQRVKHVAFNCGAAHHISQAMMFSGRSVIPCVLRAAPALWRIAGGMRSSITADGGGDQIHSAIRSTNLIADAAVDGIDAGDGIHLLIHRRREL